MRNFKDFLATESILDPVKKELSSEVWYKNKLKPSLKSFIFKRFETWLATQTSKPIKGMYVLGSITGYQYAPDADIDVNVVVDITDERVDELGKILPNGHLAPGTGHPVNYYIGNKVGEWRQTADSIYDVLNNRWLKKQSKTEVSEEDTVTNFKAVAEISRFFIMGMDASISEYDMDVSAYKTFKNYYENTVIESEKTEIKTMMMQKLFEITADIDGIYIAKHMIHSLRVEAFSGDAPLEVKTEIRTKNTNTSINNLIYKYLEKLDYFDKITSIVEKADFWIKEKERVSKL